MGSETDEAASTSAVGDRMKMARQALGWSTRKAVEQLRPGIVISHATLANYERGTTSPPIEVLAGLAALYDRPVEWFVARGPLLRCMRYRNVKSKVGVRDTRRFEGDAQRWLDAYVAVERYLDEPLERDLDFAAEPDEPAAETASRLREALDLGDDDPVPSVVEVLEHLGVRVIELETEVAIDGLAAVLGDEHVVVLNPAVSNDRARMNAAHELGHVVRHDCGAGAHDRREEKAAFELASQLLLTPRMLSEAFKHRSMVRLVEFKERFGISLAGMVYRAQNEDVIDSALARRLWIEFGRRGWRRREPGRVRADRAVRFETLVDSAMVDRSMKLPTLAGVAGVRAQDLRRRLALAMGFDPDGRGEDPPEDHTLRLVR